MATIDDVREYWDARPCNIRHSTAPFGTIEYFEQVAERKYRVEPHIPLFANFPRWKDKNVLEIGCGIGTDTISFAQAGAKVTAVDLSEVSLGVARQRAKLYGLDHRINFVQANVEALQFALVPRNYDLIYSFGVLHHTPNPRVAFEQIAPFARQGTTIFKMMVYNKLSWKALALTKGRLWDDKAIAKQSEAQAGCPVTHTYTKSSVKRALSPWFTVDKVEIDHIFPYKLKSYLAHEDEKFLLAKLPGFRSLEKVLGWHLLVDSHLETV